MTNQRQDFYDQEVVQCKHLDKLSMRHPPRWRSYLQEQSRQRQEKLKLEKVGKLQRELRFLERNMQRLKSKLQTLQHDLTLTPSTDTADLWPRQLIIHHYYHVMTHSRTHDTHEHDTYTDLYIARQQQIKLDAMLSQQFQAEEQKCLAEHIECK